MAEVKAKKNACPSCGANLTLKDGGYGETTCKHCRAIIFINRSDTPDGKITVNDEESDKPLATLKIPLGWEVKSASINYHKSTLEIPYGIMIALENNMGSSVLIDSGDSFVNQGAIAYYHEQTPHTMQHEFVTVDKYLDEYVHGFAKLNNKPVRFKEDLDIPLNNYNRNDDFIKHRSSIEQEIQSTAAATGGRVVINGVYCDSACRAYTSGDSVIVAFTREVGSQAGLGNLGMFGGGEAISNMIQGLGGMVKTAKDKTVAAAKNSDGGGSILNRMADSGLLGGMLGKKYRSQPNRKIEQQPVEEPEEVVEEPTPTDEQESNEDNPVMIGRMNEPGQGEWLEWRTGPVFLLITSKSEYENLVKKAFKQICSSFKYSPEVVREHRSLKEQMEQQNNAGYQQRNAAMRQNGEALIRIGQQRSAANQSYIESMMNRSNQQYQAQRESYSSRMAAQDRMRDARSEAIRGVNTYIKPDGKEVEVPVSADTAWINGKGEIIGGSAGFNPGSDWTQLERK